jgi:hypothetical protein
MLRFLARKSVAFCCIPARFGSFSNQPGASRGHSASKFSVRKALRRELPGPGPLNCGEFWEIVGALPLRAGNFSAQGLPLLCPGRGRVASAQQRQQFVDQRPVD